MSQRAAGASCRQLARPPVLLPTPQNDARSMLYGYAMPGAAAAAATCPRFLAAQWGPGCTPSVAGAALVEATPQQWVFEGAPGRPGQFYIRTTVGGRRLEGVGTAERGRARDLQPLQRAPACNTLVAPPHSAAPCHPCPSPAPDATARLPPALPGVQPRRLQPAGAAAV